MCVRGGVKEKDAGGTGIQGAADLQLAPLMPLNVMHVRVRAAAFARHTAALHCMRLPCLRLGWLRPMQSSKRKIAVP